MPINFKALTNVKYQETRSGYQSKLEGTRRALTRLTIGQQELANSIVGENDHNDFTALGLRHLITLVKNPKARKDVDICLSNFNTPNFTSSRLKELLGHSSDAVSSTIIRDWAMFDLTALKAMTICRVVDWCCGSDQFELETKLHTYHIDAGKFAEMIDEFDEPEEFIDKCYQIEDSQLRTDFILIK